MLKRPFLKKRANEQGSTLVLIYVSEKDTNMEDPNSLTICTEHRDRYCQVSNISLSINLTRFTPLCSQPLHAVNTVF